jgi:twitching motility protein PilU
MIVDKLFQADGREEGLGHLRVRRRADPHQDPGQHHPDQPAGDGPETIQRMAYEMLTPEQIAHFEETFEINLSFGIRDIGNFRVNMFWQRGTIAIVLRFIQGEIPKGFDELRPAADPARDSSWRSAAWCWSSARPARASRPRWPR